MGQEIERKFLVIGEGWRAAVSHSERYRQAYLANNARCSVRVRLCAEQAWLNIKSATLGAARAEFEYSIPAADGEELFSKLSADAPVEKLRHFVTFGGNTWEIDEFLGANAPLIVAELELSAVDEAFERPPWLGEEVTDDLRYYNVYLAHTPYQRWVI